MVMCDALYVKNGFSLPENKHVPEVIAPNEPDIPHTEDAESPPDLINTEGTHEQNVQDEQISIQSTEGPSGQNTKDRWSKNQHIELVNIIGDPGEGMLTRIMAAKLTTASATECLFADFLSEIEPKKEEGIDYDEIFAPVAMMEAIRIFIAFATYMNFTVFQMDVKSVFLNGKPKEEVYVKQPPSFESSEFPDHVCKLDKALYGLKQAPRAWYETLSTFLIQNTFARGRIDNTMFIYKSKGDVLLVQVYVDDIIFGSTSYKLCKQFEKLMTKKFEMSMIGELTYFLRLQFKQNDKGISICQEQYTRNLLKKYEISDCSSVKTPMVPPNNLGPDLAGKPVSETSYKGMIRSRMYLTSTMHDIKFSTVLCARYQSNPKESHLIADTPTQTILVVIWTEKAPHVPAKYLVENWFVGVLRNSSQWLCSQLRLNMLLLLGVMQDTRPENCFSCGLENSVHVCCSGTKVDIGEIIYSDLVTRLTNKSRQRYVSYPRFVSRALAELLGPDYTQNECFESTPTILSNSGFSKDLSKVTPIELADFMVAVNNREHSVNLLPFTVKKKKEKNQIVTPTLPQSQGPEAPWSLPQKRKKPKSKKTPTETKGTVPDPQDPERNIQLAGTGLPSTLDEGTHKSQLLPEGKKSDPKDLVGNIQPIDTGLPSTVSDEGAAKTTPLSEGTRGDKDLEGLKPPADMEPLTNPVVDPSGTDAKYQTDQAQSARLRYRSLTENKGKTSSEVEPDTEALQLKIFADVQALLLSDDEIVKESDDEDVLKAREDMDEDTQADEEEHQSLLNTDKPEPSPTQDTQESDSDSSSPDLKKCDNILSLTERQLHEEAAVSYSDLKASIKGYYEENVDHREQTNKLVQATMDSLDKTAIDRTNLLNALTGVTETLKAIQDAVKDDPALNKKVIEATKAYTKNSIALTELLTLIKNFDFQGLKMTVVESSQAKIRSEITSLRLDTSDIKSMMTEIYQDFKVVTEEPPSYTKGETEDMETQDTDKDKVEKEQVSKEPKHVAPISTVKPTETPTPEVQPITTIKSTSQSESSVPQRERKGIATDDQPEQTKLVKASSIVRPDLDAPILVPYMINEKLFYLTEEQIQAHLDKEDQIKKAEEEAKRLAMTKTKVIKIVQEEAKKIGIDPKKVISAKAGEKFKKAQDAEMQVYKRQHTKKVKRLTDLNKKRVEQYMNNDKRNFDVHNPFKFADFGITELDELVLVPEKDQSQSSGRKKKYMELEPEIKLPRLECNRSLPEGVPFVNNMVIEEPEYGIFFTDVFGDQAFQRWNDIHKVGVDSLVSYLVMASMVKTPENARFCLKLKKLIVEHLDQEKFQSKKVKLEVIGYMLD
ncbi:retrovirus-related pol polyprotein from transposon TNT 1-94 [Tanacetum coccineum]